MTTPPTASPRSMARIFSAICVTDSSRRVAAAMCGVTMTADGARRDARAATAPHRRHRASLRPGALVDRCEQVPFHHQAAARHIDEVGVGARSASDSWLMMPRVSEVSGAMQTRTRVSRSIVEVRRVRNGSRRARESPSRSAHREPASRAARQRRPTGKSALRCGSRGFHRPTRFRLIGVELAKDAAPRTRLDDLLRHARVLEANQRHPRCRLSSRIASMPRPR